MRASLTTQRPRAINEAASNHKRDNRPLQRPAAFVEILQKPVLWIRIGFNADPDPVFYLNVDPDPDQGSQTNADPCGSGSRSDFKVEFLHEK